jgi:serine phosphatase RsbU (regulator of sigma subunit)
MRMRQRFSIALFLFVWFVQGGLAQHAMIDSLKGRLAASGSDTARTNTLNLLSEKLWRIGIFDSATQYADQALTLAKLLGYDKGKADALANLGVIQWNRGNYAAAMSMHLESLQLRESIGNRKDIATSYNHIGNVHWNQGNIEDALLYHKKALKIREEIRDAVGTAASYNNIGILYIEENDFKQAKEYLFKSVEVRGQIGDSSGMATAYNNIGIVYESAEDFAEAAKYYGKSLDIRRAIGDRAGLSNSLNSIGFLLVKQKKFADARKCIEEGLKIARETGSKRLISNSYQSMANLDSATGNYLGAYENKKLQILYRDSMVNELNTKKSVEAEMTYEFEKRAAAVRAEQEKTQAIAEADNQRQVLITWAVAAFGLLILLFTIFVYRSNLQKQQVNQELDEKNQAISEQKRLVELKNQKITDSIEYARSIQEAILPGRKLLDEQLGEWFIFFRPKDLVSGDFYWSKTIKDKTYLAAVDCTGHGVPGAFMSLMAFNMLENVILKKEFSNPGLILDELNEQVRIILKQQDEHASAKYGLDIALMEIDRKKGKVEFAGAHNSLYLVRASEALVLAGGAGLRAAAQSAKAALVEYKANNTTIGMALEKFTNYTLAVQPGDMLYMFTDGYADQKGGPENRKFLASALKNLLAGISPEPCSEQLNKLERNFAYWREDREQIDDVLVIGVRI